VVEAFGEIVDPLPLFHEIAKRAVELLAISICSMSRYEAKASAVVFLGSWGDLAEARRQFACSITADAALAEYDRWTALD